MSLIDTTSVQNSLIGYTNASQILVCFRDKDNFEEIALLIGSTMFGYVRSHVPDYSLKSMKSDCDLAYCGKVEQSMLHHILRTV